MKFTESLTTLPFNYNDLFTFSKFHMLHDFCNIKLPFKDLFFNK